MEVRKEKKRSFDWSAMYSAISANGLETQSAAMEICTDLLCTKLLPHRRRRRKREQRVMPSFSFNIVCQLNRLCSSK